MPKCSAENCEKDAVGGFEERGDSPSFEFPKGTFVVDTYYWCAQHEAEIKHDTRGLKGKLLSLR